MKNKLIYGKRLLSGSTKKAAKGLLIYLDIGLPHRGSSALVDIAKMQELF